MTVPMPIETRRPKSSRAVTGWTTDCAPWMVDSPNLAVTVTNDVALYDAWWPQFSAETECHDVSSSTCTVGPLRSVGFRDYAATTYTLTAETIIAALRDLMEHGATPSARTLLAVARRLIPSAELVFCRWGAALAMPVPREEEFATGQSTADNYHWLDRNKAAYAGQWVALRDGVLLDADPDRLTLHRRLKSQGNLAAVFFAKAPIR